jgi:transmembrane sensor
MMDQKTEGRLADEALDWITRLHSGRAGASDRAAFETWRSLTPAHESAARDAETLWDDIGRTDAARLFQDRLLVSPAPRMVTRRRLVFAGAAAASAAGIALGTGALPPFSGWFSDYATGTGERRSVRLPDGSTVFLNTGSALSLAFSPAERRLSLPAGEAVFEVAHEDRPFIVEADEGEVRATGTVFGLRWIAEGIDVSVAEGSVLVSLVESGASAAVSAGQGIRYDSRRFLSNVAPIDAGAALAWHRGKLIFNNRPLEQVVAELERYRVGRIVIAGEALRSMPVSGVFDLEDIDGAVRTIAGTLQAEVLAMPFLTILRQTDEA